MKRITQLSDFFHITKDFSEKNFYRGEDRDYGDTACVSTAIRDSYTMICIQQESTYSIEILEKMLYLITLN